MQKNILITGNEALALGALKAGLKFYAAYPMTPTSAILHFMAAHEHDYKIIVKHTEDEIAAMNMVIGASLAGARAMCATAGGGFSLMVEGLGFGAIIETPFVCVVGGRPGPATGLPTWSSQGDLRFVMHASQDEFPRVILAPGDPSEAFRLAYRAFNIADRHQIPVLILTDKHLGESSYTVSMDDFTVDEPIDRGKIIPKEGDPNNRNKAYKRYDWEVKDGVSPRALPGTPGHLFLANSDEHDEYGYSEEDGVNRIHQMEKRMRKLESFVKAKEAGLPVWYGHKKADITLICWGSTKGTCVEVSLKLKAQSSKVLFKTKPSINVLHFTHIYPLDIKRVKKELAKIKKSVCVECNYSGQFADYLYEKTGYKVDRKLVKYDGRPWFTEELKEAL